MNNKHYIPFRENINSVICKQMYSEYGWIKSSPSTSLLYCIFLFGHKDDNLNKCRLHPRVHKSNLIVYCIFFFFFV